MLFFIGLIIYFLFYIFNAYQSIIYPYQIGFGEGYVLNHADMLSKGHSLYNHNISTYPFLTAIYGPICPLICAGLIKIFGVSFAPGRFLGMSEAILIGALIYKIIQEETKNNYNAVISSLFFFASPYVYCQSRLYGEIVTLGMLFSLIGIYLVLKYEKTTKIYLSIPLFLLAVYTRQTFIAAAFASFIYLFTKKQKSAVKYVLLYMLSGLFIFLLANHVTDGQFYRHMIQYNIHQFNIFFMVIGYVRAILLHSILFGFAAAYALYVLSKKQLSLFVIYFLISAGVAVTIGKAGSGGSSYMFELITVSYILFGMFFNEIKPQINEKDSIMSVLIAVMLILQLILFAHAPFVADSPFEASKTPTHADVLNSQKVSLYIKNASGPVLSEDAGFALLNDKEVLLEPFVFTQLYKQGMWDQKKLVGDIHDRKFSLILLKFDLNENDSERFTKEMLNEMRKNYYFVDKIGDNYIYKPKTFSEAN